MSLVCCPANQCVVCGQAMPEGDMVCHFCRERYFPDMLPFIIQALSIALNYPEELKL